MKIMKILEKKLLKNYIRSKNRYFKIIFKKNINLISIHLLLCCTILFYKNNMITCLIL